MENGAVKFLNGDGRKHSLEDDPIAPLLLKGDGDGLSGDEVDEGSKSPTEKTVKENHAPADRIKRKAKRLTKVLAKEVVNGGPLVNVSRYLKNSRKPRNGFGRGLPKKGMYQNLVCILIAMSL